MKVLKFSTFIQRGEKSIIFYQFFHSGLRGSWCLVSPAGYGQEAGYTLDRSPIHRKATHKQPCTNSFTHLGQVGETNSPNRHVFRLWEEARVPGENPRMHGENMQTPSRKIPGWESKPGSSCCKATVLPTAPPCSPDFYILLTKIKSPVTYLVPITICVK
ncbi:hypothetical protein GOODEAATRI_005703 [Goodea atripinnis]|uniref:Uncharacterized protein n=1 Tax=Goodea atripinnis TaxID=208336 RepID=A0ABV0PVJ2_9TELE